jgi:WD40 repeat protein
MRTFADVTVTAYDGAVSIIFQKLCKKLRSVRKQYTLLAAGFVSGNVLVYNITDKKVRIIEDPGPIYAVRIFDSDRIAYSRGDTIYIHQLQENEDDFSVFTMNSYGKRLFELKGHTSIVYALQYLDGVLYSASYDRTVRAWNLDTRALLWSYEYQASVYDIMLSCNSRIVIGGELHNSKSSVEMLDTRTGQLIYSVSDHKALIYRILCTKEFIITLGFDRVIVRDKDLEFIREFAPAKHYSAAMIDDEILATSHEGNEIGVWNIRTGKCVTRIPQKTASLVYSGIPGKLYVADYDGNVMLLDVFTQQKEDLFKCGSMTRVLNIY